MGIPGVARMLIGMAWSAAALAAPADETIFVQVPAELDPTAPIAAAVQRECNVETVIGNYVLREVQFRYGRATSGAQPGHPELRLTILGVLGVGPGPWSGSKTISVRADLVQNGTVSASNVFRRAVGGGGRIRGACELFDIVAGRLARDIAHWLPAAIAEGPAAAAATPATAPQAPARPGDATQRMRLLKELLDGGLITKDDYERKRAEVLKEL